MAHLVDVVFQMELVLCHLLAQLRCKSELVVVDLCFRYFNVRETHILAFRELIAFDPIRLGASNGAEVLDGMHTIPKSMLAVPAACSHGVLRTICRKGLRMLDQRFFKSNR